MCQHPIGDMRNTVEKHAAEIWRLKPCNLLFSLEKSTQLINLATWEGFTWFYCDVPCPDSDNISLNRRYNDKGSVLDIGSTIGHPNHPCSASISWKVLAEPPREGRGESFESFHEEMMVNQMSIIKFGVSSRQTQLGHLGGLNPWLSAFDF